MVKIRPNEVSRIIRQQIEKYNQELKVVNVGTVLQVGDGIGVACLLLLNFICLLLYSLFLGNFGYANHILRTGNFYLNKEILF